MRRGIGIDLGVLLAHFSFLGFVSVSLVVVVGRFSLGMSFSVAETYDGGVGGIYRRWE